jgi:seryl-tRNA synthetase
MNEQFDFSKLENQQKFDKLSQEEKERLINEAHEEALKINKLMDKEQQKQQQNQKQQKQQQENAKSLLKERKEEEINKEKLRTFMNKIYDDILNLVKNSKDKLEDMDYIKNVKRLIVAFKRFLDDLKSYYDIVQETGKFSPTNPDERSSEKNINETRDYIRRLVHNSLIANYLLTLRYYQTIFNEKISDNIVLTKFFEDNDNLYGKDKNGALTINSNAINLSERSKFGEYLFECYQDLIGDEEAKSEYEVISRGLDELENSFPKK